MIRFACAVAFAAGLWFCYRGYERQQSLAGRTASVVSSIGKSIDGSEHPTEHLRFYVLGGALVVFGAVGFAVSKD